MPGGQERKRIGIASSARGRMASLIAILGIARLAIVATLRKEPVLAGRWKLDHLAQGSKGSAQTVACYWARGVQNGVAHVGRLIIGPVAFAAEDATGRHPHASCRMSQGSATAWECAKERECCSRGWHSVGS